MLCHFLERQSLIVQGFGTLGGPGTKPKTVYVCASPPCVCLVVDEVQKTLPGVTTVSVSAPVFSGLKSKQRSRESKHYGSMAVDLTTTALGD